MYGKTVRAEEFLLCGRRQMRIQLRSPLKLLLRFIFLTLLVEGQSKLIMRRPISWLRLDRRPKLCNRSIYVAHT